jgi:phage shock protein C
MSMSEELVRLAALHERGVLSDEEFARAKARVLGGAPDVEAPALRAINALRRSRSDRWLGGVCGGIARMTGVDSWIWRLLFALLALCAGTGVLIYLLMWILIPADPLIPGAATSHSQAG